MSDDLQPAEQSGKPVLLYPFEAPPAIGQTVQVAPGVVWLRMPLPFALNHINVWALEDQDGWAVVDTGIRTDETAATWRAIFASSPDKRPLTRVFVTHMHPDHIGMAGWLTRKLKSRLWITRLGDLDRRALVSDTRRGAPPEGGGFQRR